MYASISNATQVKSQAKLLMIEYSNAYKNACIFVTFYEPGFVQNILSVIYISFDLERRCKAHSTVGNLDRVS